MDPFELLRENEARPSRVTTIATAFEFGRVVTNCELYPWGGPAAALTRKPQKEPTMQTVRAKFKVDAIERTLANRFDAQTQNWEPMEVQTVKLSPVFGNGDPNHENTRFWQATPSGQIHLGCVNADAAALFQLGQEYYIDLSKAE